MILNAANFPALFPSFQPEAQHAVSQQIHGKTVRMYNREAKNAENYSFFWIAAELHKISAKLQGFTSAENYLPYATTMQRADIEHDKLESLRSSMPAAQE